MKKYLLGISAMLSLTLSKPVFADDIEVAVSIAPLRLIVERLVGDFAAVNQIIPQGQSAHHSSLRPSQRQAVARADMVILTHPQLEASLAPLMQDESRFVILADHLRPHLLPLEASRLHDHDHHDEHHDEHGHDEHHDDHHDEHGHDEHHDEHGHDEHHDEHGHDEHHDEHGHDEHHDEHGHDEHHDEHGHDEHHDEHGHDEHHDEQGDHDLTSEMDYHIWLAPQKMVAITKELEAELSERFPEQKAVFAENSADLQNELMHIDEAMKEMLAGLNSAPFITMHHVTAYLEDAYNLDSIGAILPHAEGQLSAGHLRDLQDKAADAKAACLFYEPEFSQDIAIQLADDLKIEAVLLDPLGATLSDKATIADYWQQLKSSLQSCFSS